MREQRTCQYRHLITLGNMLRGYGRGNGLYRKIRTGGETARNIEAAKCHLKKMLQPMPLVQKGNSGMRVRSVEWLKKGEKYMANACVSTWSKYGETWRKEWAAALAYFSASGKWTMITRRENAARNARKYGVPCQKRLARYAHRKGVCRLHLKQWKWGNGRKLSNYRGQK